MKLARTVALLAALSVAPAFADCAAPEAAVQIPNGSEATRDEMILAHKAAQPPLQLPPAAPGSK